MHIEITQADDRVTIVLRGRFDFATHQPFRRAVDRALRQGGMKMTVDLSAVNFIDSPALGMLLLARESCQRAGGYITLGRPQPYVAKVLKLCEFDQLFDVQR